LPPARTPELESEGISFAPNLARKSIFAGKSFVTLTAADFTKVADMITKGGGTVEQLPSSKFSKPDDFFGKLPYQKCCVIVPVPEGPQLNLKEVLDYVKQKKISTFSANDIAFSVLYAKHGREINPTESPTGQSEETSKKEEPAQYEFRRKIRHESNISPNAQEKSSPPQLTPIKQQQANATNMETPLKSSGIPEKNSTKPSPNFFNKTPTLKEDQHEKRGEETPIKQGVTNVKTPSSSTTAKPPQTTETSGSERKSTEIFQKTTEEKKQSSKISPSEAKKRANAILLDDGDQKKMKLDESERSGKSSTEDGAKQPSKVSPLESKKKRNAILLESDLADDNRKKTKLDELEKAPGESNKGHAFATPQTIKQKQTHLKRATKMFDFDDVHVKVAKEEILTTEKMVIAPSDSLLQNNKENLSNFKKFKKKNVISDKANNPTVVWQAYDSASELKATWLQEAEKEAKAEQDKIDKIGFS